MVEIKIIKVKSKKKRDWIRISSNVMLALSDPRP
mgnify:CR=1 FL=1|jgi:hypothetical protein